jgi:hypothetical protein
MRMSAQVLAHPAHVHQLGGYSHASYWLDRGFHTRASATTRFIELVPATPNTQPTQVVRLYRPTIQRLTK